jgi:hypothetical protein
MCGDWLRRPTEFIVPGQKWIGRITSFRMGGIYQPFCVKPL